MMEQKTTPHKPLDEIRNNNEVRVYRLHLLEQGQERLFRRIDELENNLSDNYGEQLEDHETRIRLLEECCANYTKLKWLIIGEAVIIIGAFFKSILGV